MLDSRNDLIVNDYSKLSADLARIGNMQNDRLNLIAREAIKDSRLMRVLTVIAMAYAPAGILAVRSI